MPNVSTEDYVKAIYKLGRKREKVTTSALAAQLQIADASVTDMVKRLSERGYVHYEPYQGVTLTAVGRRMALAIVRRHRLWEMFLVQYLGFSWDQVHIEAERLEHVTSNELERRIDESLGFPAVDPHGDPIPSPDGVLAKSEYVALSQFGTGDVVRILRVSDDDPEILQHATKLGIGLNTRITVKEKLKVDGSMVLRVGSKKQYVSQRIADSIFVEPV